MAVRQDSEQGHVRDLRHVVLSRGQGGLKMDGNGKEIESSSYDFKMC